jgi:DNA-binding NarL/FixJ family response regulator
MVTAERGSAAVRAEARGIATRSLAAPRAEARGNATGHRILALELRRRARSDALPEHTHYLDTGCDVHPRCLTCPLVRCRYDEPGGARKLFSEDRDRSIVSLQREGVPVGAIARRIGVSRRTVFRALARARVARR